MAEKHLPPPSAPGYFQVDSFHNNFISSPGHGQAATERRHYSFSTDPDASPFANASSMEYDQTEGLGGLSVSSYDSVEDERSPIDPRIYQYHGKSKSSRAREASQFAIFSLPGSSMMYAFLARDAAGCSRGKAFWSYQFCPAAGAPRSQVVRAPRAPSRSINCVASACPIPCFAFILNHAEQLLGFLVEHAI